MHASTSRSVLPTHELSAVGAAGTHGTDTSTGLRPHRVHMTLRTTGSQREVGAKARSLTVSVRPYRGQGAMLARAGSSSDLLSSLPAMRLKLNKSTDLALRAMRVLCAYGDRLAGTALARTLETSDYYLPQIMAPLVRRGWVTSTPGPNGGL